MWRLIVPLQLVFLCPVWAFHVPSPCLRRGRGKLSKSQTVPNHQLDAVHLLRRPNHLGGGRYSDLSSQFEGALRGRPQETETASVVDETGTNPLKPVFLLSWALFIAYAILVAPGKDPAAQEADKVLVLKLITNPVDPEINRLFNFVFNALGVLPAVFMAVLLPGGGVDPQTGEKRQKVPPLPYLFSSLALGFFATGPYLALRSQQVNVGFSDEFPGKKLLENRLFGLGLFAWACWLSFGILPGSVFSEESRQSWDEVVRGFKELWSQQALVHVSSLDFLILSIAFADPLREDMTRRGVWGKEGGGLRFLLHLFPLLGPSSWIATRPPLPSLPDDQ